MLRGVLGGIGLGAVFSVTVAVAISVLVPIQPAPAPQTGMAEGVAPAPAPEAAARVDVTRNDGVEVVQPQVTLRAPVAPDAPQEPPAAAAAPEVAVTAPEPTGPSDPQGAAVSPPSEDAGVARPAQVPGKPVASADDDSAPQVAESPARPATGAAADLTAPDPVPAPATRRPEGDDPVLPNPQALAPMIPDDSLDEDVQTAAAAPMPPADSATAETDEIAAESTGQDAPAPQNAAAEEPSVATAPEAPAETEEPASDDQTETAQVVRPRVLPLPGAGADAATRPRIGKPARTLISPAPATPETETVTAADVPDDSADLPPIRRYAAAFENPDDKPLMSILLIDDGVDLDTAEIGLPALSSFPYPVSFAVDADLPDAPARMARYRAEGFEVLAMVDLPQGARPTDAEVSLGVALAAMPQIVGVLEGTGAGLQPDREVADQVTQILKGSGLGLVAQSKGLDSMPKLAVKTGVPAVPVFRDFDSKDQTARVIRRFLDQAAFKAGQEGGVVMLGRLRPETIKALLVWGLADRASTVALAPVSAVLIDQ